jgi:hypothetical protein
VEKFLAWLQSHDACNDGVEYVQRFKSPQEFWDCCAVPEFSSWIVHKACVDDYEMTLRTILCMSEAIQAAVSRVKNMHSMAVYYMSLITKSRCIPIPVNASRAEEQRLVRRFLAANESFGWNLIYGLGSDDACALIRKHFPTIPLNLGD